MSCNRVFVCLVIAAVLTHWSADPTCAQPTAGDDSLKNEMQDVAAAFMTAFRNRDIEAIASMWTAEGLFINEQGERIAGRDRVKAEYAALFEDAPDDLEMLVEVDSAHRIGPQTVVVEARAALSPQPPGESRVISRYTAIHVRGDDGKWRVAHLRDNRIEIPPAAGKLEDLGNLAGSWQASRDDVSLEINCRWVDNNQFLERTHTITRAGEVIST
ncbi:MAG: YybH family protein, partial [Pirellulaceae bacterium]